MNQPSPSPTLQIACDACGASLTVSRDSRYVTCEACDTNLVIQRIGRGRVAKRLAEIGTEPTSDETDEEKLARLERELRDAERKWKRRRRELSSPDEEGNMVAPTRASAAVLALGTFGFGIMIGARAESWPVLAVVTLIGLFGAWITLQKAQSYGAAEHRWSRQRAELREAIRKLRGDDGAPRSRRLVIRRRDRRR